MKKIDKLAIQLFSVRENFKDEEQARKTLKTLKNLGYDQVQTAGCYGFTYDEFYEMTQEAGLEIIGTHENFKLMKHDIEKSLENHKKLHTSLMGCGGFPARTEEEVAGFIMYANQIAQRIAKEGMKFTYHNHSHEFARLVSGKTAMEMLIEGLDPKLTSFCLDAYWMQHGGVDVCKYISKLTGRIDIIHLKDMKIVRENDGAAMPRDTVPGMGNMNFEDIIPTAMEAGAKYFCVEHDGCPVDFEKTLEFASEYLHKNFM